MLDVTFFGYGAGIVMVGWIVGMCSGAAFDLIMHGRRQ